MRLSVVRIHPAQPIIGRIYIHVKLPFLKQKSWPRIAPKQEEKLINGSESDHLEDHCMKELMDAVESKDVKSFRAALEALILNCFEDEDE